REISEIVSRSATKIPSRKLFESQVNFNFHLVQCQRTTDTDWRSLWQSTKLKDLRRQRKTRQAFGMECEWQLQVEPPAWAKNWRLHCKTREPRSPLLPAIEHASRNCCARRQRCMESLETFRPKTIFIP